MPHSSSLSSSAVICCGDFRRGLRPYRPGNVAEFALIGTAAGILNGAEKIMLDVGEFVGRNRKAGHVETVGGFQHDLLLGPRRIARQPLDQIVGGVAEFPDMQIVERGIVVRAGRDRRSADRHGQIEGVRAAADIVHLLALDVHAADEHGLRPFEIFFGGGADVLVDEAYRPIRRHIGRDQQNALRRHEGLDARGQGIGVFEGAE